MFLKISQYAKENTCVGVSFQQKPVGLQLYEKETTTQVFYCEYCEIFKNIFFFTECLRWLLLLGQTSSFLNSLWNVCFWNVLVLLKELLVPNFLIKSNQISIAKKNLLELKMKTVGMVDGIKGYVLWFFILSYEIVSKFRF